MIRHIVFWKFHEQAEHRSKHENLIMAKQLLMDMQGKIPGLITIDCGININQTDASWDLALYTEFDNQPSLDAYQEHPDHMKVKKFMAGVRDQRAVVDWKADK